jgi:hypothetical protein
VRATLDLGRGYVSLFCVALLPLLPVSAALAQDSHYWSNQFGDRSAFLGGAVVGGVRDSSATFYNPGALGFVGNANLTVGANAFELADLHVSDGVGGAADLDSEEVQAIPLLVSGVFDPQDIPGLFAYSLFAKNSHAMKVSGRRQATENVLDTPSAPGPERFSGQFSREDRLLEVWGGVSYAYRFGERFSTGLSTYAALRNQKLSQTLSARALNEQTHVVATRDEHTDVDFWNLRLLGKAGLAAEFGRWRAGLTLTSPSLNLAGRGDVSVDLAAVHLDVNGDGDGDHFFANSKSEGIASRFRSPLSVALGAELDATRSTRLCASAEWFQQVGQYRVLSPKDPAFDQVMADAPALADRSSIRVTDEARSVVNFAVGIEQELSEGMSAYLSARTDKTYLPNDRGADIPLGFSNWDLVHFTTGVRLQRDNSDFGLGFGYTYGQRKDFPQAVNFSNPTGEGLLVGKPGQASATFQAYTVLLGVTYYVR